MFRFDILGVIIADYDIEPAYSSSFVFTTSLQNRYAVVGHQIAQKLHKIAMECCV